MLALASPDYQMLYQVFVLDQKSFSYHSIFDLITTEFGLIVAKQLL